VRADHLGRPSIGPAPAPTPQNINTAGDDTRNRRSSDQVSARRDTTNPTPANRSTGRSSVRRHVTQDTVPHRTAIGNATDPQRRATSPGTVISLESD
jgi:hypothetical protein